MWNELAGGALIGLAAAVLWLGIGRIGGISGVVANLFLLRQGHRFWSLYFLIGLLLAYPLYVYLVGTPDMQITNNKVVLVVAGILVGAGTYIGNGCTSGHGVCGNGRLSLRSIVATCTFMAFGMLTVLIMNNLPYSWDV
ncbi:MAG: YeeE/YedE thiosulfate transporter family protein [Oleispira sp.]